jgi:hypothetical protein
MLELAFTRHLVIADRAAGHFLGFALGLAHFALDLVLVHDVYL